jgi:hypothetical protein
MVSWLRMNTMSSVPERECRIHGLLGEGGIGAVLQSSVRGNH